MIQVRDLDRSLLERNVLANLLRLGPGGDAGKGLQAAYDGLCERVVAFVVEREGESHGDRREPREVAHPTLRLRRLRTLLHLVDGDLGDAFGDADAARTLRLRALWLGCVHTLLARVTEGPPPMLRRTLLAALSRALDAAVRLEACEPADAFLVLAGKLTEPRDFDALAEASMETELRHVLGRYAAWLAGPAPVVAAAAPKDSLLPPAGDELTPADPLEPLVAAFGELAMSSPRLGPRERARRVVRLHGALDHVRQARSLCPAPGGTPSRTCLGRRPPPRPTSRRGRLRAARPRRAGDDPGAARVVVGRRPRARRTDPTLDAGALDAAAVGLARRCPDPSRRSSRG